MSEDSKCLHRNASSDRLDNIMEAIFVNNRTWAKEQLETDETYFTRLAAGQSPQILYFGCSDSRVTAEEIMGLKPGDAFIHRNIANMVNALDLSAGSTIDYAVTHLKVKHVIVMGHYGCGGVKAAMESKDLGILNPWLRQIRDVYRTHHAELDGIQDEQLRYDKLVEFNVQEQCLNVLKTAQVQRAFDKGLLQVHGLVFDFHTGKLINLNIDAKKMITAVKEIYNINCE